MSVEVSSFKPVGVFCSIFSLNGTSDAFDTWIISWWWWWWWWNKSEPLITYVPFCWRLRLWAQRASFPKKGWPTRGSGRVGWVGTRLGGLQASQLGIGWVQTSQLGGWRSTWLCDGESRMLHDAGQSQHFIPVTLVAKLCFVLDSKLSHTGCKH